MRTMDSITIPRKLAARGDLIVIPKEEYDAFSEWRRAVKVRLDERWFWTPEWQQKEAEADWAIQAGRVSGPYSNLKALRAALTRKTR